MAMGRPIRCLALGCALLAAVEARSEILWQIGKPDESSGEFSHWRDPATGRPRLDYGDATQDPVFRVGRDDPARHWFAFQPGPANGAAGFREHPFTIEFELGAVPTGGAQLTLHLLAYSVRLPRVQVDLNGQRGWYHQAPTLTSTAGDAAAFYLPHYSRSLIRVRIPATALRIGGNRLVLTPLDSAGERDDAQPSGFTWPGVSGLVHDALVLETIPSTGPHPEPRVELTPTPFFRREGRRLNEQVELTVDPGDWARAREVDVSIGAFHWSARFPSDRSMGEARWTIEVPEFTPGTVAQVRLRGEGLDRTVVRTLEPARRWTLLLVPNQHLDIGYTDHPSKISELQSRAVDQALDLIRKRPEFRYTLDGSWVFQEYLRGRSPERREALIRAVRRREIEVPAVYASHFTGFASLENLIRSLYPSRRFSREHGLPFGVALSTDVPSHSGSWPSVLAAAGVDHFVAASDAYRAPFLLENGLHRHSPFLWEGPDGGRVWTWYSRHYHQGASLFGSPPRIESAEESLPRFLQAYDHPEHPGSTVILYGTQVENVALDPGQASFAERWNQRFAFPRLEYSTFARAMTRVTRETPTPRVVRGDGGPYWEDGLAANARITTLARNTMARARTAEIFSTIASVATPGFQSDPQALGSMWESLLLTDEHTWHADVSVSDPDSLQSIRQGELRDHRTVDAARSADHLLSRALAALADRIPNPSRTLVVFNSLAWERDGWVEGDIPKGFHPVDLVTGEPPASEVVRVGNGFQRLRFLARGVPSVGYRCYSLRPLPKSPAIPVSEPGLLIETPTARISLDPSTATVRSWTDPRTGREWVRPDSAWGLHQHLYVTGADQLPNRLVQYSTVAREPELQIHAATGGRLLECRRHPWGVVVRMAATNLHHPRIETSITLRNDSPVLEFETLVQKLPVRSKEAAYFVFPFDLAQPRFRLASQNGFIDPEHDLLPGAGREWFCHQEWIAVAGESSGHGILWSSPDAPLVTLGDIARGRWPKDFGSRPGTIFSYVMANYTPEGYKAEQGGVFRFRYRLQPFDTFNPVEAHRRGAEALTPLELHEITRNDKLGTPSGDWPADQHSFLTVEPGHVSLVTWKAAESGTGTILRLVETGGTEDRITVRSPLWKEMDLEPCTAVEDPIRSATAPSIGGFGIGTFRLAPSRRHRSPK